MEVNSTPLSFRATTIYDAPALWALMDDYKAQFTSDFESVDKPWLIHLIRKGWMWVITDIDDDAIGGLWIDEYRPECSLKVHFLLHPAFFLKATRQDLFPQLITHLFEETGVLALHAEVMETQHGTRSWLKHLGFQCLRPALRHRTRKNGEPVDCYWFQMTKKRWMRLKK